MFQETNHTGDNTDTSSSEPPAASSDKATYRYILHASHIWSEDLFPFNALRLVIKPDTVHENCLPLTCTHGAPQMCGHARDRSDEYVPWCHSPLKDQTDPASRPWHVDVVFDGSKRIIGSTSRVDMLRRCRQDSHAAL
jgi:hypothetical protein